MPKTSWQAYFQARRSTVQTLYAFHISRSNAAGEDTDKPSLLSFLEAPEPIAKNSDVYFRQLALGIMNSQNELNALFEAYLDRPLATLDPIELSILQLGCYELCHQPEMPWRVIIDDAVKLAHLFCGTDSYKYINSLLDKVAHRVRSDEEVVVPSSHKP